MNDKDAIKKQRAVAALQYILPILKKYKFKWCISGPLACYLYGVKRPIGSIDIDIDIEIDKEDPKFQQLIEEVKPHTRLPFQLWIDKNYDNWVMNVVIQRQIVGICPTPDLKLFNKETGKAEVFYPHGIPDPMIVNFEGLKLPLAPKESVLRMKKALAYKKPIDRIDIKEMERILKK